MLVSEVAEIAVCSPSARTVVYHGFLMRILPAIIKTAVSITDNASMFFGGSDAPSTLGCLYSMGDINKANNGTIQNGVTDIMDEYGVTQDRIYINFFDVPPQNVGWNRATFAG